MIPLDTRFHALSDWVRDGLGRIVDRIEPASGDASFRRYFRARIDGSSYILMDAPPPRENIRPFLAVAELMRAREVRTPEIYAADPEQGFALLEDFGNLSYLEALSPSTVEKLYGDALAALLRLQTRIDPADSKLPAYDEPLLLRELEIFRDWFLGELLGLTLRPTETLLLKQTWQRLIDSALEQPRVLVHRDYHSRNLMLTDAGNPGVLDFQDAVIGPVTYDPVSLLRDCYIAWPQEWVQDWVEGYRNRLRAAGVLDPDGVERFRCWFDWMGMQRHLKAIGIFSRLKLRDAKSGYLKDIPRTLAYVSHIAGDYPEFGDFLDFLETRVRPRLPEALAP